MRDVIDAYADSNGVELIVFDGLDDAIIGLDDENERVVYSRDKIIIALTNDGMTEEEALEYFDYNIGCMYVGEHTPLIINTFSGFYN